MHVKVDMLDMYNPLSVTSGLYDSLHFQLMRNAPARRKTTQVHS